MLERKTKDKDIIIYPVIYTRHSIEWIKLELFDKKCKYERYLKILKINGES